jgi:hypothetical protein
LRFSGFDPEQTLRPLSNIVGRLQPSSRTRGDARQFDRKVVL